MKKHILSSVAAGMLTASLGACGGGGGSSTPPSPPPPPPPQGTSVASVGVVTGFGSVFVNGVKYEVEAGTVIAIEGEEDVSGDDSVLAVGMKVSVDATEENGVRKADRIEFDEDLKGPATNIVPDAVNPSLGTFEVVGQTVIVDANTVFDNNIGNNDGLDGIDIRDLAPEVIAGGGPLIVEVSGFATETGVLATRVEREDDLTGPIGQPGVDGDEIEVKGFVDTVAEDGSTIAVNGAVFLINSGTLFDPGLAANADLVGVYVEVKADIDGTGDMVARSVEREDDFAPSGTSGEFEIEGLLQSVDTLSDPQVVVINGITLEVADASALVGLVGQRVELYGTFDSNNVLVIATVQVERENSVEIEDRVTAVDTTAETLTTRLGIVIEPTGSSRISDDTLENGDNLSVSEFLAGVSVGDYIEARGVPNEDGSVDWTRIELEDEDEQACSLKGPVASDSIADPEFGILSVTVDTTTLDDGNFENANDVAIGRVTFFSDLTAGAIVEAESDEAGLGCTSGRLSTGADGEVSFEPEDGVVGNGDAGAGGGTGGNPDLELQGTVRNLDATANTFTIGEQTITVTDDTLIDGSIVEAARGVELGDQDFRFGDLPETLDQLISDGDLVGVQTDGQGNAVLIEDI